MFTNNDSGYQAAINMANAGMEVRAVVDVRMTAGADVLSAVAAMEIPIYLGHVVPSLQSGLQGLKRIELAKRQRPAAPVAAAASAAAASARLRYIFHTPQASRPLA